MRYENIFIGSFFFKYSLIDRFFFLGCFIGIILLVLLVDIEYLLRDVIKEKVKI